jgi:DNA-3-methyladenine glycosylase
MRKILKPPFFRRPVLTVARGLLGKYLVRRVGGKETALMITDVEAYLGLNDKASHASRGKTARNAPMFGPGGFWYVYFTYGMHWILNAVTGTEGRPSGVMFRAVEGIYGPARLTKALGIDRRQNHQAISKATGLWIEDRGVRVPSKLIRRAPRIGVDYAGDWAAKPYRLFIDDKDFIARYAHPSLRTRSAPGRSRPARRRRL